MKTYEIQYRDSFGRWVGGFSAYFTDREEAVRQMAFGVDKGYCQACGGFTVTAGRVVPANAPKYF